MKALISGKHNRNTPIWHFDLLQMAWQDNNLSAWVFWFSFPDIPYFAGSVYVNPRSQHIIYHSWNIKNTLHNMHTIVFGFVSLLYDFHYLGDACYIQYIPRNMHTVFALLCFVVVIHWLIFPYPSGLLHWHCGNLTIAPVPAKQPWWIWINTSCEFIMNDCITTTKQSTTKSCVYLLGYTVFTDMHIISWGFLH